VALACGMVPLADGSDTGGSLRNPASFCNVVGFRPSPGRVPTWPALDPWSPLSVEGPLGRTVADVALLLAAMAGPDARCPLSLPEPGVTFARPLERDVRGIRVAWSADAGGLPVEPAVKTALARARDLPGATSRRVRDGPRPPVRRSPRRAQGDDPLERRARPAAFGLGRGERDPA